MHEERVWSMHALYWDDLFFCDNTFKVVEGFGNML